MTRRSRGEGSIYQLDTGAWVAQITLPDGRRKSRSSKSQKVCRDWLQEQRNLINSGTWVASDKITVGDYLDRWYADVAVNTLRPKTLESYAGTIRLHLKPEIGSIKLTALRPDQIQAMYTRKLNQGLSNRSVQYIHAILHRALSQAEMWGLVSRNMADLVRAPVVRRSVPKTLTPDQAKILLDSVKGDRLYPLYVLAISVGMRMGELLGLHWEDIDLQSGMLSVRHAVQQLVGTGIQIVEPKSDKSKRTVALPRTAIEVLQELKEREGRSSGLVFHTKNGTPIGPRNLTTYFKHDLEQAGLPEIRFHDLRHTAATLMLTAGVHPKVVQETLGHSQIGLTLDTYSHVLPVMQKDAADKMDVFLQ
jgi:integrase